MRPRKLIAPFAVLGISASFLLDVALPASAAPGDGSVTVNVFRDLNGDGVLDAAMEQPVAGIEVTVTDASGSGAGGTTNASGQIVVPATDALQGGKYRVEASIPDALDFLYPAPTGADSGSLTQFVDVSGGEDATVDMAVWNPADYVGQNPQLLTSVQNSMKTDAQPDWRTVVSFDWDQRGNNQGLTTHATEGTTGAVFGMAYDRARERAYEASFFKRWTWFGGSAQNASDPRGAGYIYATDMQTNETTRWGYVPGTGTETHDQEQFSGCYGFFPLIGRRGVGGVEISEDGQQLYAVNMNDGAWRCPGEEAPEATNSLAIFDANAEPQGDEPVLPTKQIPIPAPANISDPADWHPMAVKVHDGKVYVGGVDSAEQTGNRSDLKAVVLEFDPKTEQFTEVLNTPLDYQRGAAIGGVLGNELDTASHWNPWLTDYDLDAMAQEQRNDEGEDPTRFDGIFAYPSPMLADLEFLNDGTMILGFRDRTGDQITPEWNNNPDADEPLSRVSTGGDINKACLIDGEYVFEMEAPDEAGCENNANPPADGQPAGTREFFNSDIRLNVFHQESAQGGLAYLTGQDSVASTAIDPLENPYTAGVSWYDSQTGGLGKTRLPGDGLEIVPQPALDGTGQSFGKSNGLAELELMAAQAPTQIGNRVWYDADSDGAQDPDESALPGATVRLLDSNGDEIANTTTAGDGTYYFDDVQPGNEYTVQFDVSTVDPAALPDGAPPPDELVYTASDAGDDSTDSDAKPVGDGPPFIGQTTVTPESPGGAANHTLDAGVKAPTCTIGDLVWTDSDGDGVQDPNEPGVPAVTVDLYDADGNHVSTTKSDANGNYQFADVSCGTYTVGFTDLPQGYQLTAPGNGDPAMDSNADPGTGRTAPFEVTTSKTSDQTIDAGLLPPTCTLGDLVWQDTDGDGVQDDGEAPVPNVKVELLDADGNVVATTTTDDAGRYSFADISCGDYRVRFNPPPGYDVTSPSQGGDDARDSNPNPDDGTTPPVSLTADNPVVNTVDAGITPICGFGDLVWYDEDGDGVQDEGEPGVPDVTVHLMDTEGNVVGTATTDAGGHYAFGNLVCGDYQVHFVVPDGYGITSAASGDPTMDSNANPADAMTPVFSLTPDNPTDPTIDTGLVKAPCTIGDLVWVDDDADGMQDDGESGLDGATVELLDHSGAVVASTTTTGGGHYLFEEVPCGDYVVRFTLPPGYNFTAAVGGDPVVDSNPNPETGVASVTVTGGENLTIDAGVTPPPGLAETGTAAGPNIAVLGLGLIAIGGVALVGSRQRRRS